MVCQGRSARRAHKPDCPPSVSITNEWGGPLTLTLPQPEISRRRMMFLELFHFQATIIFWRIWREISEGGKRRCTVDTPQRPACQPDTVKHHRVCTSDTTCSGSGSKSVTTSSARSAGATPFVPRRRKWLRGRPGTKNIAETRCYVKFMILVTTMKTLSSLGKCLNEFVEPLLLGKPSSNI